MNAGAGAYSLGFDRVARLRSVLWVLLAATVAVGLAAAAGVRVTPPANGATTASVTYNGTVAAAMSISTACDPVNFAVGLGTTSYSGACAVSYGATNDATQKLTMEETSAAPFLGTIPNTAVDCNTLASGGASDQAGVHITGTANNSTIMAAWATSCTTAATAGQDEKFRPVPASGAAVDACSSSTTSATDHSCSFEIGVKEDGSNLAAGTYSGTALWTVVDLA